jgi:hypothetical protein
VPHSFELLAVDATDLGVLIGVVGLVFAFTENRRARRAEAREKAAEARAVRAEERAEHSERREEQRHERELAEADARQRAKLVLEVHHVSSEPASFVMSVYLRNIGAVTARQISLTLADGDGQHIGRRVNLPGGSLEAGAKSQNFHLQAQVAQPEGLQILATWIDEAGSHADEPIGF